MSDVYLIRKGGMYYGHDNCGYVSSPFLAEIYSKDEADSHAKRCDELSVVPVSDVVNLTELSEHMQRMACMINSAKR